MLIFYRWYELVLYFYLISVNISSWTLHTNELYSDYFNIFLKWILLTYLDEDQLIGWTNETCEVLESKPDNAENFEGLYVVVRTRVSWTVLHLEGIEEPKLVYSTSKPKE